MRIESVVQNVGEFTSEAILISDVDLADGAIMTLRWCNPAFERMTGFSMTETVGNSAKFLVGEDTDPDKLQEIIDQLMNWESFVNEMRTNRKDGTPYWVEMSWQPLRDETGSYQFWICVLRDITPQKQAQQALHDARKQAEQAQLRLIEAIEALDDPFVIFDADDKLVMCNQRYVEHYETSDDLIKPGVTYQEILHSNIAAGAYPGVTGDGKDWIKKRLKEFRNPTSNQIAEIGQDKYFKVVERRTAQNDLVSLRIDITESLSQQKKLEKYAADLDRARARNEYASLHDELTDLPNRRYLDQELAERVRFSERVEYGFGVLHIDLDRFKQINDTYGHDAGDMVLCEAAKRLEVASGAESFVARVGGDEFVVLLDGTDLTKLQELADKLIATLCEPVDYNGNECHFGASVGVSIAEGDLTNPRKFLISADIALYEAKKNGRNQWKLFTKDLQDDIVRRKRMADDLMRAIDSGEFIAFYQPQFDAKTLDITGVEALVRWDHPERGILTPYHFMNAAEDLNVVHVLDQAVLQRVSHDFPVWDRAGISIPKVSVNVSGERLRQTGMIAEILASKIDLNRLSIELLESIFLDEQDDLLEFNLDQLKEMGCSIELDDFGTGHSSLISLIRLQPSKIKIDRQFITPVLESNNARNLVGSMIEIGHSLNVSVVAEGVETREHGKWLVTQDCDILQGFAYGRPISSPELIEFCRAENWRKNDALPATPITFVAE